MAPQERARILIVANQTASTPRLIEAVRRRATAGPCTFALLIPDVTDRNTADWTLETAQRLLQTPARGSVEGLVGGPDPFASVEQAVREGDFDEIIISTMPGRVSKWLRRDLPHRVERLGLPVTVVTTPETDLERLRVGMRAAGGAGEGGGLG
jgi:hypothetical protein